MEKINKKLYAVNSKESFISFLDLFVKENSKDWENNTLDTYLSGTKEYTEDIDGFYKNLNNPDFKDVFEELKLSYGEVDMEKSLETIPPIAWRIFADILYGAKNYE